MLNGPKKDTHLIVDLTRITTAKFISNMAGKTFLGKVGDVLAFILQTSLCSYRKTMLTLPWFFSVYCLSWPINSPRCHDLSSLEARMVHPLDIWHFLVKSHWVFAYNQTKISKGAQSTHFNVPDRIYTVDSRYLDPSYLDPITYVELISKSRLFSLCIYCISASRLSNYFYVDTSAISSIIFSPWIYFSQFLLPRISNSEHDEGKKCKMRRRRSLS